MSLPTQSDLARRCSPGLPISGAGLAGARPGLDTALPVRPPLALGGLGFDPHPQQRQSRSMKGSSSSRRSKQGEQTKEQEEEKQQQEEQEKEKEREEARKKARGWLLSRYSSLESKTKHTAQAIPTDGDKHTRRALTRHRHRSFLQNNCVVSLGNAPLTNT